MDEQMSAYCGKETPKPLVRSVAASKKQLKHLHAEPTSARESINDPRFAVSWQLNIMGKRLGAIPIIVNWPARKFAGS